MPISPICFAEWRGSKKRFCSDFHQYAVKVAAQAGLKPKIVPRQTERAHYYALRHFDVLEAFFLPQRDDGTMPEASQLKQVGTYLHYVSRFQPVVAYEQVQQEQILRLFGVEEVVDESLAELLQSYPTDGLAFQYFYDVAANFERTRDRELEFSDRLKADYIENVCAFLSEGRHDPDGLYLIYQALML